MEARILFFNCVMKKRVLYGCWVIEKLENVTGSVGAIDPEAGDVQLESKVNPQAANRNTVPTYL